MDMLQITIIAGLGIILYRSLKTTYPAGTWLKVKAHPDNYYSHPFIRTQNKIRGYEHMYYDVPHYHINNQGKLVYDVNSIIFKKYEKVDDNLAQQLEEVYQRENINAQNKFKNDEITKIEEQKKFINEASRKFLSNK